MLNKGPQEMQKQKELCLPGNIDGRVTTEKRNAKMQRRKGNMLK